MVLGIYLSFGVLGHRGRDQASFCGLMCDTSSISGKPKGHGSDFRTLRRGHTVAYLVIEPFMPMFHMALLSVYLIVAHAFRALRANMPS